MLIKFRFTLHHLRKYSSQPKVKLIESFNSLLENNEAKHRKHPGIIKRFPIGLPEHFLTAAKNILDDLHNKYDIYAKTSKFRNQLRGRHVPLEEKEIKRVYATVQENLLKNKAHNLSDKDLQDLYKKNRPKTLQIVKKQVNLWKEIIYNEENSLLYLTARSPQDYAVLHAIFNEIRSRDEKFTPQTVIDFGSGIGIAMWAINEIWPKKVREFMNIDISNDINSLSERIIKSVYPKFHGIFYRQFMPMSLASNYDIAVSAYSLTELPNVQARLDIIMKLWKKTNNYLIIIEQGTNAGFQIVNEARDFILHLSNLSKEKNTWEETHVFAPCPHDFVCPKKQLEDSIPCNFEVGYCPLPMLGSREISYERYSYVVFKKGSKKLNNDWPRIVRPTLKKGKHAICRMCSSSGNLEEIIFTPTKHGRNLYRCARVSKWGDRIPLENSEIDKDVETERTNEEIQNETDEESETKK